MPTTKPNPSSPTSGPTRDYATARKALRGSSKVSKEEAREQILRNGPKQSGTVSYNVVKQDGVSILKRSVKP
jgi:hypothetical protein